MEKRKLGSTGDLISEISFGGAAISGEDGGYGFGPISEQDSCSLVELAVERGINHFDTAPIYGFGESERRLAKALQGSRDQVFITSKSGIDWHSTMRVNLDNSAPTTQKMLEQSLRDLKTDYIDYYFIHWPDPRVDIRYPMEVLSKAKAQGKIRFIGLSNTNDEEIQKASEIDQIDLLQAQYNILNPDFDQIAKKLRAARGTMGWGTFHKGVLTGTVDERRQYELTDGRKKSPWWKRSDVNRDIQKFSVIKNELENRGINLASFALGYSLKEKFLSTALVGMRTKDYLEKTIMSLGEAHKLIDSGIYDELKLS